MVKKFITFEGEEPTGVVVTADDVSASDFPVLAIEVDYLSDDNKLLTTVYQLDGQLLSREPRPDNYHVWQNQEWVFDNVMYVQDKMKQAKRDRVKDIAKGFEWADKTFQIESEDIKLISGRTAKLTILLQAGEVTRESTEYVDLTGEVRKIMWRAADNTDVYFTVGEYLTFAQAIDEYIEDIYQKSWFIS
jgi:hypothetical protein